MTIRTAHRFATYPGDVTDTLGAVVGPNTVGEWMTAVEYEYNTRTDRTRIGFDFAHAAEQARAATPPA